RSTNLRVAQGPEIPSPKTKLIARGAADRKNRRKQNNSIARGAEQAARGADARNMQENAIFMPKA
ncbi:hypothetical protein A2U01_0113695, partial [Trifolium medium]|nr:hypothetical protein [Trifolium medium]